MNPVLTASEEVSDAYITLNKRLDEVMLIPFGPERWRQTHRLLKQANPIAGSDDRGNPIRFNEIDRKCIADNKRFKEGLINKFGGSQKGDKKGVTSGNSFRASLSMPRLLHHTIELVDPTAFREARNRNKMFNMFPQYTRAEATNASTD